MLQLHVWCDMWRYDVHMSLCWNLNARKVNTCTSHPLTQKFCFTQHTDVQCVYLPAWYARGNIMSCFFWSPLKPFSLEHRRIVGPGPSCWSSALKKPFVLLLLWNPWSSRLSASARETRLSPRDATTLAAHLPAQRCSERRGKSSCS